MKTIKLFIISFLFLIGNLLFGQYQSKVEENIKKDFLEYSRLLSNKNIDSALTYVNPKLFDIASKDQLKTLLNAFYNAPQIEFRSNTPTFQKFGKVKNINNTNYVVVKIITPIELKFNELDLTDDIISKLQMPLENKFGKGNVKINKETGFFEVHAPKEIVASSDDGIEHWKFIVIDNKETRPLLEKIIPAEVLNEDMN